MQLFIVTAALFAGFALSQNLTQIEDLPACGVRVSSLRIDSFMALSLTWT